MPATQRARHDATVAIFLLTCCLSSLSRAQTPEIDVQGDQIQHKLSRHLTGACIEDVNHEIYGGLYSQMLFGESFQEEPSPGRQGVSGAWTSFSSGGAEGSFELVTNEPFVGRQSQRLAFASGSGVVGLENQGLNGWGLHFVAGRPYEGCVCVRAAQPAEFVVSLESGDGRTVFAETNLAASGAAWRKLDFVLTPRLGSSHGRFALKLKQPGALDLGYAFLQPGDWGRFKGLPVRGDVAETMMDQGVTVLRYGGSMVNADEYRWKKMIGPREHRPPYHGTWYPHSSNGWGIIDFLNFCEAGGFLGVPAFNINETPQDMADFIEYVNGSTNTEWGARRAADGHPAPYALAHVELGNEERVDDAYAAKFAALATALWAKDPALVPVVGDFGYQHPIEDPFHFDGADSHITSLAGQRTILQLTKEQGREVWFDVHVWTDGPRPTSSLDGAISFRNGLDKIADGARFAMVIFELNAENHSQRRALANALAIERCEEDGRIPIVTSANGLQPDGQNDNGWDQGLLFLNPWQAWLQPPGYVTQLFSRAYEPELVQCTLTNAGPDFAADAARSEDGSVLTLRVINLSHHPRTATLRLHAFAPRHPLAQVEELAAPMSAQNSFYNPVRVAPRRSEWRPEFQDGRASRDFAPESITVIRFD